MQMGRVEVFVWLGRQCKVIVSDIYSIKFYFLYFNCLVGKGEGDGCVGGIFGGIGYGFFCIVLYSY